MTKLLDLTPRRVQQLAKEGVIPKPATRGQYEIIPSVVAYIRHLRAVVSGDGGDLLTEKTRLARTQAEKTEVEIARLKGFSPIIYICPAGYPTIGYGHVVLAHEQEQFAAGITSTEAIELLRKDVRIAERTVLRLISVPLTDGQFDALVSFTFNLGAGARQRSTLRLKVHRCEHKSVPAELMKWVWADGKKLPGLIRRRQAEGVAYASVHLTGMEMDKDAVVRVRTG